MIPIFNSIWGITKRQEKEYLSEDAKKVLKVLRKEWEMATADLRTETKLDRAAVTKAIDELQTQDESDSARGCLRSQIYLHLDTLRSAVSGRDGHQDAPR